MKVMIIGSGGREHALAWKAAQSPRVEPKETEGSHLVQIYDAFATPAQRQAFRAALHGGLSWGEAKDQLFALVDAEIGPMRERYDALMANPEKIEAILMEGAAKARAIAAPLLARAREAVGLRRFQPLAAPVAQAVKAKSTVPAFKQYRESDGLFYFKLLAADGTLLLQSTGLPQGKEAGQWVAKLKREGAAALDGAPVSREVGDELLLPALEALVAAELEAAAAKG